jgi:hypothetical protein
MTSYKRNGNKWTINETLTLQREYELLELTVQEMSIRHQRSENAILYRLESEGFIECWSEVKGFDLDNYKKNVNGDLIVTDDEVDDEDDDADEDYEEEDDDDDEEEVEKDIYEQEVGILSDRVWSLETSVSQISSMVKQIFDVLTLNKLNTTQTQTQTQNH